MSSLEAVLGGCSRCAGAKWIVGENGASRCPDCRPSLEDRLRAAGLTENQLEARLDRVDPQLEKLASTLRLLAREGMVAKGKRRSLLLHGLYGRGKTWLAAGLCREILEVRPDWRVRFVRTRSFLDDVQECFSTKEPIGRLTQSLLRADLLVLNDMPRERISSWVREVLETIIDTRLEEQRSTVITMNPAVSEDIEAGRRRVVGESTLTLELLAEMYGPAVASRLGRRFYTWLLVDGQDLRDKR